MIEVNVDARRAVCTLDDSGKFDAAKAIAALDEEGFEKSTVAK